MSILRALKAKASSKLRVDRGSVDETSWGDMDLTKLDNDIAEAWADHRITRAAIEEIYAFVEPDAYSEDDNRGRKLLVTKLHGPHHVVKGNKIVLSTSGLYALVRRLGQTKWGDEAVAKAKDHIRRHYNQFGQELPDSVKVTKPTGRIHVYRRHLADGTDKNFWVIRSSNSFEDNGGRIIPQKGLEWACNAGEVLEFMWGHRGYLNLYHEPAATVGVCVGQMMMGRFLVEWGWFFDTEMARKTVEWVEKEGDNAGASVEIIFDGAQMVGNEYPDAVLVVGRALCHRDRAENSLTTASALPVVEGNMSNIEDLAAIIGEDEAKQVLEDSVSMTAKLEESGISFKTDEESEVEEVVAVVEETEVVAEPVAEPVVELTEPVAEVLDVQTEVTEEKVEPVVEEVVTEAVVEEDKTEEVAEPIPEVRLDVDELWEKELVERVANAITEAVKPIVEQSGTILSMVESLTKALQDIDKKTVEMEAQMEKHEKTIGTARVIFSGEEQRQMRPTQKADASELVSEITAETVLTDNEQARAHYVERRKRIYGY